MLLLGFRGLGIWGLGLLGRPLGYFVFSLVGFSEDHIQEYLVAEGVIRAVPGK